MKLDPSATPASPNVLRVTGLERLTNSGDVSTYESATAASTTAACTAAATTATATATDATAAEAPTAADAAASAGSATGAAPTGAATGAAGCSGGSTRSPRSTGVTRSARPTRCAGVIRAAGMISLAPLPLTPMQWLGRYHLDRVIVTAVPVRVRTPSWIPNVARAPLREWPRLSLGLVGSAQSDQSQACGHYGRCCCKTCVVFHIALLPREAVHQDQRAREEAVRSAFDGSESPFRTLQFVTQRTFYMRSYTL